MSTTKKMLWTVWAVHKLVSSDRGECLLQAMSISWTAFYKQINLIWDEWDKCNSAPDVTTGNAPRRRLALLVWQLNGGLGSDAGCRSIRLSVSATHDGDYVAFREEWSERFASGPLSYKFTPLQPPISGHDDVLTTASKINRCEGFSPSPTQQQYLNNLNNLNNLTQKETMLNSKPLVMQTLIFGAVLTSMCDSTILLNIERAEGDIKRYKTIAADSKYLQKRVSELQEAVKVLVAELDRREAKNSSDAS